MKRSLRFTAALALVAGFIILASPGDQMGKWYYDSGVYIQQGYDIFGGRPPVYPVFLQLVGRNVVHYQIVLGVASWCLLGYLLAGFPGLILGGVFIISPWFARWHGNCLTESFSHSFAALTLSFSIMLIGKLRWFLPWFISLILFAFTRFTNVIVLPFFCWPAFFLKGASRWLIIGGITISAFSGSLLLHSEVTKISGNRRISIVVGHLSSTSSHREALNYLIGIDTRPFFGSQPMPEDHRKYMPKLSKYSNYLEWLKLPRHSYLWLFLTALSVFEIFRRKRLNIYSVLIISLFFAGYLQCFNHILYEDMSGVSTEVWRHLAICDAFLSFSVIALVGMLLPKPDKQTAPTVKGFGRFVAAHKNLLRVASCFIVIAGLAGFTAAIYSPSRFRPEPHEYGRAARSRQGQIIGQYLEEASSQAVDGWSELISSPHSAPRATWDHQHRPASWIFADNEAASLTWSSSVCPEIQKTTLVFGGILSGEEGGFRLFVNGKAALTFNIDPESSFQEWEDRGFRLAFFPFRGEPGRDRAGIFCLTVPGEKITAGQSLTLRVAGRPGDFPGRGYFMLDQDPDTLRRLGLD